MSFREFLIHFIIVCIGLGVAGSCLLLIWEFLTDDNTDSLVIFNNYIDEIYISIEQLPQQSWQAISAVLNYIIYIGGLFLGIILRFITLLNAHFPGGILGIVNVLFVIVFIIFWRRFRELSEKYTRCKEDNQKLEVKLAETLSMLQKESQQRAQETQNVEKLKQEIEKEKDGKLCAICQDRPKTIVLLPCNHMCLCRQCLDRKKWKECPICRKRVESNMEIYV
jgi:hypothetical protein